MVPVRVEACAYRGVPVDFELVLPWSLAVQVAPSPGTPAIVVIELGFLAFLLAGAVVLARINLRLVRDESRSEYRRGEVLLPDTGLGTDGRRHGLAGVPRPRALCASFVARHPDLLESVARRPRARPADRTGPAHRRSHRLRSVAFDRTTGKEVWRALGDGSEPGYNSPVLIEAGGMRQVIIWHPEAVSALDPASGKVVWEVPFAVRMGLTVATPVFDETRLLVSSFYDGARMLALDRDKPVATLTWAGTSSSEIETDTLHALITTPVLDGDFVYGVGSEADRSCRRRRRSRRRGPVS